MNSTPHVFSEDLRHFVGVEQWKFASMLPDWPHEYLVRERVDRRLFERVVKHIHSHGYEGRFYEREIRSLRRGGPGVLDDRRAGGADRHHQPLPDERIAGSAVGE